MGVPRRGFPWEIRGRGHTTYQGRVRSSDQRNVLKIFRDDGVDDSHAAGGAWERRFGVAIAYLRGEGLVKV